MRAVPQQWRCVVSVRHVITGLLVAAAAVLLPASLAGASMSNPYSIKSLEATAKADAMCNAAILSDKVVTMKTLQLATPAVRRLPGSTPAQTCSYGPNV